MSVDNILGIASSALDAQSERITLIAQNLANANSIQSAEGGPYQRRIPVLQPAEVGEGPEAGLGVKLAAVLRDTSVSKSVYDPSNPLADENGMLQSPNVDPVFEMVDLMQATRSYEANVSIIETAKTTALRTLDLLK